MSGGTLLWPIPGKLAADALLALRRQSPSGCLCRTDAPLFVEDEDGAVLFLRVDPTTARHVSPSGGDMGRGWSYFEWFPRRDEGPVGAFCFEGPPPLVEEVARSLPNVYAVDGARAFPIFGCSGGAAHAAVCYVNVYPNEMVAEG
jgi:hypothetical protein